MTVSAEFPSGHVRPKIAIVVTSVFMVRFFLVPHLTLLSKRYDITLILKNDAPAILAEMDLPVRIIEIGLERKISPRADLAALLTLFSIFRREGFQSVHTITPKAGLLGTIAAFFARVPVRIHTFQGEVWANTRGWRRRFFKFLDRIVALLATHLTVVSHSEREFLLKEGILPKGKAEVLGAGSIGGVDPVRFAPDAAQRATRRAELGFAATDTVFAYIGRLCADKGVHVLADAFARLAQGRSDLRLLLVGPDEEGIVEQLRTMETIDPSRITILPFTPKPENDLIAGDVLVLPSFREGFGVVVIEAAALGLPAIGSNIYGISDAIDVRRTGLLFAAGDAGELAEKMRSLADDPALRQELGDNARNRAITAFSQSAILGQFDAFYRRLPLKQQSDAP